MTENRATHDMIPDSARRAYVGAGDFDGVGQAMLAWFKAWGSLQRHERVLEIGCGIGRIAIPLTQYLDTGSYVGFDIVREGVEWCQQKITPRYPNFKFFVADVGNRHYNPQGGQAAAQYRFPFEDATFDFVFLTSVFTHLLPADLEHYTAEISRVLRPGGRCFCTVFMISEEARDALAAGGSVRPFKPTPGVHWAESADNPESAVAYRENYLSDVFRKNGLEFRRVALEEWWKSQSVQDIVVLRKKSGADEAGIDFTCNVCGHRNYAVALGQVRDREASSCVWCQSSLRMRSIVHALSLELHGRALPIPRFPVDRSRSVLGMSDWEGYAKRLAGKHTYVNTSYHTEPRLDITEIPDEAVGSQDFLVSGDVFEHIPGFALDAAFRNCRRLLRKGGALIFTVPFTKHGETEEHFPRLHDFTIFEEGGKRVLHNRTADGRDEVYEDLVFHGGDGMTLEMRIFSEPDLVRRLRAAGFSEVRICTENVPEFGIIWPMDWAVPIVARA